MKSLILTCLICIETVIAMAFATAAALAYGSILPTTTTPSVEYSSLPTPRTSAPKITSLPDGRHPLLADVSKSTLTNSTVREGLASWYDRESCIRESGQAIMANLQPLDDNAMTCALWITGKHGRPLKPDGRLVKITSVRDGSRTTAICAWTDNGPGSVPRSQGVICDLTPRAMRALAGEDGIRAGRVEVTMEEL